MTNISKIVTVDKDSYVDILLVLTCCGPLDNYHKNLLSYTVDMSFMKGNQVPAVSLREALQLALSVNFDEEGNQSTRIKPSSQVQIN